MKKIDREIIYLNKIVSESKLPGYPADVEKNSFFAEASDASGLEEYYSGENNALENELKNLWSKDTQMQQCIPIILAAVEKSREQKDRAVVQTELYNYAM